MHKAATPTQDKALTPARLCGPRVEVVLVKEYKHYRPGDVVDVTPGDAGVLINAGIGAAL